MVSEDGLGNLIADAHDWIECGHRLLKDHGDARATKLAQLIGRESGQAGRLAVAILKSNFALDDGGWWKQAHDRERGNRFAGAGFADQAKHFPWSDGKRKAANRGYRLSLGSRFGFCARLRELDGQIADVEQRAHEQYGISAARLLLGP